KLLRMANDEDFIQLVWAIDAIQSDRAEAAKQFLQYPAEAATSKIGAPNAIHKWELETLVGLRLALPKLEIRSGINRTLNCSQFGTAANLINTLRKLEDSESAI